MTTDRKAAAGLAAPGARETDLAKERQTSGTAWLLWSVLGLAGFAVLTIVVDSRVPLFFDQPLLDLARGWNSWAAFWRVMSESANIPLIVIGFGLVGWLFATKRRREALVVLLILAAITAGSEGVKQLVARPRPEGTDPNIPGVVYSYPSGHVLEALTIFGIIAIRCWRSSWALAARLAVIVLVVVEVIVVGVARVALSAHFPSDVLAAILGGIGVLGLYGWFTRPGGWGDHLSGAP
jgi:undecaprenyl-diphosphatase